MTGLWVATFAGPVGSGAGVVVFQGERILGGDGGYSYVGTISVTGDAFTAEILVAPHTEGAKSIFGTTGRSATLKLQGTISADGKRMDAVAFPTIMPMLKMKATLTKLAE